MSLYAYEALDRHGRSRKGEVEAASERLARQQLKKQGLVVRSLQEVHPQRSGTHRDRGSHERLKASETSLFLEQLATLVSAGMTLTDALESIADSAENRRTRRVILALRQQILEGSSLAQALASQRFEEVICNMVAAGEETGQLEAVAVRLAELLSKRQQLKQDLLSATLYPLIILLSGLGVMLFLLAVVVPQVVSVFAHAGADLPWLTKMVIALSTFLRDDGKWVMLFLLGLLVGCHYLFRLPTWRARRDKAVLKLPLLGALFAKVEMARFARTLGMLMSGGVPVLAALHIANQSWTLIPLRKLGERAREQVREGGSLSRALGGHPSMPRLAFSLMEVGEKSGRLDNMLVRLADHFERDVARLLKRFLTMAEPILILFMALCVGALAMAILLPIAQMNELVR
ncbi:MAG: hypothetical protein D6703_04970 [Zetaproteobacteria bacterium]|nr:MAG: hypothetical protein D6703_04970 [Zetaproteobacteria bacterium]